VNEACFPGAWTPIAVEAGCQDLGPDKLYSTLRSMTSRSSICAFLAGKLRQSNLFIGSGSGRDVIVLVEAASRAKEPSYNYLSASGKYCCSLFACAYVEESKPTPMVKLFDIIYELKRK
jgi:hypothetical protein